MTWDYELARRIRAGQERREAPAWLEGEVVRTDPLTVSLYGGEVMAPPAPLKVVEHAPGYTVVQHVIRKLSWNVGDRVVCCWMGKSVVILGRLT